MRKYTFLILVAALWSCQSKLPADAIYFGAEVYTVAKPASSELAFAVKEGKIIATGTKDALLAKYQEDTLVDLSGKYVYPGFNDGHAHFHGYASLLLQANLVGTKSFDEVIARVIAFNEKYAPDFIEGRGWDQNDWQKVEFPTKHKLDSLFPATPVLLKRIDGHAAIANQAALDYALVDMESAVTGGVLVKDEEGLTGVLIDNAVDLVIFPKPAAAEMEKVILWAQDSLLKYGITSVTDAGLERESIETLAAMQDRGELMLRINAMVKDEPANWEYYMDQGKISTDRLQVQCFKIYMDGALGSRGALLLEPYADDSTNYGLLLHGQEHFKESAQRLKEEGWQLAVHAIGDSANRYALNLFNEVLAGEDDRRWRIEHAQIVHQNDREKFGVSGIIPSVQPTHATSDMYWANLRLGDNRMDRCYPFKDLEESAGLLVFGTDFPVEHINPFSTFRAAVYRQDSAAYPAGGFIMEQASSRVSALRAMTLHPAHASFEEDVKGTIETGKWADFVVLNSDLMKASLSELNDMKVFRTYLSGELVYSN